jgi:hypothetical protein
MKGLTVIFLLVAVTSASAQLNFVNDLFFIFASSKESADSLLKAKGLVLLPVDLKTGKVKETSLLWSLHGWSEEGEQTLFEYKDTLSHVRYGFFWNRESQQTEDIGISVAPEDTVGLRDNLAQRGLFRIYDKAHKEDVVFTNADREFVLIVMPGIDVGSVMVGLFRKENELALRYLGEDKKAKKKK